MAVHFKIKFKDGHTEIHADGYSGNDCTLCSFDTDGDYEWDHAEKTKLKIDCVDCISIIEYCKGIEKSELKSRGTIDSP